MSLQVHAWIKQVINIVFGLCMVVVIWFLLHVLVFATFRIPSRSMEPTLTINDYILVLKPIIGPRLYNIYALMRNEQPEVYRIPGFRKIKRNDVLVFNHPYPNREDKLEMHVLKYYIKRCIGLPGDTLSIHDGFFRIAGEHAVLGNIESQKKIESMKNVADKEFRCFPFDSIMGWNIKEFGPLYIPRKNDSIMLSQLNIQLYGKLIEWEQQKKNTI